MDTSDPAFLNDDDMRAALATRDVGTVYRLLGRLEVSQRQLAQLTGQSQSEVSEIIKGRQVRDVRVLERITDGLGIPRARIGAAADSRLSRSDRGCSDQIWRQISLGDRGECQQVGPGGISSGSKEHGSD